MYIPENMEIVIRPVNVAFKHKDRHCEGSYSLEGDHFIFTMEQTKNWFAHNRYLPGVGDLLIPEDIMEPFVITKVDYREKKPMKAIFTAIESTQPLNISSEAFHKQENRRQKDLKRIVLRATHIDTWAKDRYCLGVYYPIDDHYVFELEQTRNWFRREGFLPRVGYLLMPEDSRCTFEITKIDFHEKRPKKAIFTAIPARAF